MSKRSVSAAGSETPGEPQVQPAALTGPAAEAVPGPGPQACWLWPSGACLTFPPGATPGTHTHHPQWAPGTPQHWKPPGQRWYSNAHRLQWQRQ